MNRREFVRSGAVAFATVVMGNSLQASELQSRSSIGVAAAALGHQQNRDVLSLLELALELGASGIQARVDAASPNLVKQLQQRLHQTQAYFEPSERLPLDPQRQPLFERQLQIAASLGARCMRTICLAGRRYEDFKDLTSWREFVRQSKAALNWAVPLAEKYRVPLALENHKDWTLEELLGLLKEFESEYFGVCLDTDNNVALLDDAYEVVEALAPYTRSVHLKDFAVERHPDGFLIAEVRFGEGCLDLKKVVDTIRQHQPNVRFFIELITRDPLLVPCLQKHYWVTMTEQSGWRLARTLKFVESHEPSLKIPRVDHFGREVLAAVERWNVKQSIQYAREQLGFSAS